jgi:CSLREA domain-containing protein
MPSSVIFRARTRALLFISICVALAAFISLWTGQEHATAAPHKSGITPAASTINVNSTADVANSSDGLCTLREAITAANNNAASGGTAGECAAGSSSGSDTINFSVTGAISLTSALPDITSDMTINGPGANILTVQRSTAGGTPNFRIFTINSGRTVGISGLTMSNGNIASGLAPLNSGGAVANSGTLILTNSTLSGNTAINGGGAIFNNGTFTLANSTVSGNSSNNWGGGIYNLGTFSAVNSTISGNGTAGEGGGIVNFNMSLILTNVTVTNNRCNTDNSGFEVGGGVSLEGANATLKNTIIAGNFQGGSGSVSNDLFDGDAIVSSSSFNLIGTVGTGFSGPGVFVNGVNNNQVGVSNPGLGPLQNNGGPTMTHALLAGSPAIDAGDNSITGAPLNLSTDQRGAGYNRGADGNGDGSVTIDIGAFEVQSILVTNTNDSGAGSLRQAITDANASPDTNAINFQIGLTGTITLSTVLPNLSTSIAINGPGANQLTVMRSTAGGTPQFRIFNVLNSSTVNLVGLTISGGFNNGGGAGTLNSSGSSLIVTNCIVSGNTDNNFRGGGISSSGTLVVTNSTVSGNTGHGIFTDGGVITISNSIISSNAGSGISHSSPFAFSVTNSTISGNNGGGGIHMSGGVLTLTNSTINGNTANGGGGIFTSGGTTGDTLILTNSTISGNTALAGGGGIQTSGTLRMTNCTISGNTTNSSGGGGIFFAGSTTDATLTNSTVTANSADFGGGLYNVAGTANIRNTIVANNSIASGGTGPDLKGTFNSRDYNLIGDTSGGDLAGTTTHNIVNVNALLGPLANNGGLTLTHALLPNSPALDAGDNCVTQATHCGDANIPQVTTDQRGFNRPVDGPDVDTTATVDIGAYETQAALADIANVSTNEDTPVQTVFDVGDTSSVTSITASSSNPTLVPNDVAHLSVNGFGSTEVVAMAPATNLNGTTNITVTVNRTGGGTASKTFMLTVNPINDAPSFTSGPAQIVNEDSGAQTVANWATNMSAGPADESAQTLFFQLTNSNSSLFSVAPAISSTGTLTYTPAANVNGSATITVVLKDNGGTANGGVDASAPQIFTITVNPVNDAPSFTKGPDQTMNNDAGAQTVNNWATDISPGPADESGQTVSFQVTANTNPALFTVTPAISPTGTLTYTPAANAGGSATITINLKDNGGTANSGQDTSSSQSFTITVTPVGGSVSFNATNFNTTESSGFVTITVRRTGDTSRAVTVDYATSGDTGLPCANTTGAASPKCDFTSAIGTLKFAAGDTTKPFTVLISQDSFTEGFETFNVTLSNPTGGAALTTPVTAMVTIADDPNEPTTNAIDDASNFVRQHYHDFLNREPDASGLAFWTNQITSCGSDQACIELRRINVSAAFFVSVEFQQTGYLVERLYRVAYGSAVGNSTFGGAHTLTVPVVRFSEFLTDTQAIGKDLIVGQPGWETVLENNKQALINDFVNRSRFTTAYPLGMTAADFVDALNVNAGGALSQTERDQLVSDLTMGTKTRAQVLRAVAEDQDLYNDEFNRAFVLMQYYGYLRRNPNDAPEASLDYTGFDFWLRKLNAFHGNYVNAQMVQAFLDAGEYRQRFGPP